LSAKSIIQERKFSIISLLAIATANPNIPADANNGVIFIHQTFRISKKNTETIIISAIILNKLERFFVNVCGNFLVVYFKIIEILL
jgi:hypothetical protein